MTKNNSPLVMHTSISSGISTEIVPLREIVVYPSYGVARIAREITKEVSGASLIFLELKFISRDVTILVPKEGAFKTGMRPLSTKKEISEIFDVFCFVFSDDWIADTSSISWNRRSKEYLKKMRTGVIRSLAEIYRDLLFVECNKILSFGEKSIFAQIEQLLCEEYAVIFQKDVEETKKFLKEGCILCLRHYNQIKKTFEKKLPEDLPLVTPAVFFKEILT